MAWDKVCVAVALALCLGVARAEMVTDGKCTGTSCGTCIGTGADGCFWCSSANTCHLGATNANCTVALENKFCQGRSCNQNSHCEHCSKDPFCGWCASKSMCVEGNELGPLIESDCNPGQSSLWNYGQCGKGIEIALPEQTEMDQLEAVPIDDSDDGEGLPGGDITNGGDPTPINGDEDDNVNMGGLRGPHKNAMGKAGRVHVKKSDPLEALLRNQEWKDADDGETAVPLNLTG